MKLEPLVKETGRLCKELFTGDVETFTVDVAQDAATNAQNNIDPKEGKNPALFSRGDTFIVDGTIYLAGSLPSGTANKKGRSPGFAGVAVGV